MNSAPDHSVDAFHRGRFVLVQPKRGHRAGMDAMVLASALPAIFEGRVADLGAGAGGAALAVLSRCPQTSALLVERDPDMAAAARLTLLRPENALFAQRAEILNADVELSGEARTKAGLLPGSADAAIMNPPFNAPDDRQTADPLRRDAHVMRPGLFEAWARTAAAIVRPGGWFALIARPASLGETLAAIEGRFGSAQLASIHPRPGEAAIRFVLRARKGARGASSIAPPLILHEAEGNAFSPRADAILNGQAGLFD